MRSALYVSRFHEHDALPQGRLSTAPLDQLCPQPELGWTFAYLLVSDILDSDMPDKFARLDVLFPGEVLNAMRYDQTTRPVTPFLRNYTSISMNWVLDKGLYLFHPDVPRHNLWNLLQRQSDGNDSIRRTLNALDRDAVRHGTTLNDIVTPPMDGHDSATMSIYEKAFVCNPIIFAFLCKQTQSPPRLRPYIRSRYAECYYIADFFNAEWTGHGLPGTQRRAARDVHLLNQMEAMYTLPRS
jgi:hypothetical protein